jgi:hypothetical protein
MCATCVHKPPLNVEEIDVCLERIGIKALLVSALLANRTSICKVTDLLCWWIVREKEIRVVAQCMITHSNPWNHNQNIVEHREAIFWVSARQPLGPVGSPIPSANLVSQLHQVVQTVQVQY